MVVANYFPDLFERPESIAQLPHRERVAFLRRATVAFFISVTLVFAIGTLAPDLPSLPQAAIIAIACLLTTAITRTLFPGWDRRPVAAAVGLSLVLAGLGLLVGAAGRAEIPLWPIPLAMVPMAIYTFAAGRDYSFVGNAAISAIATSVTIAVLSLSRGNTGRSALEAISIALGFIAYFTYDLAALQSRRTRPEFWSAVLDLYRDPFNAFGYCMSVVRHWRRHRFWDDWGIEFK